MMTQPDKIMYNSLLCAHIFQIIDISNYHGIGYYLINISMDLIISVGWFIFVLRHVTFIWHIDLHRFHVTL
jgi:hypothetical protein